MISLWVFIGCSSLKVNVDYDPSFDFQTPKSFAIAHYNKEGEDTLFNDRLIKALEADLQAKGYMMTAKDKADLILTFHTNVENKISIDTDYQMIGYARYGYGGGMVATTRTYNYQKGTLIIDVLNPETEKIVWRGMATDILKEHKTPQERTAYINKVVKKTMADFSRK
jgi:uncharacterized protein DUF4136